MDLKSFRENKLKLATTAEFAKLLNVDEQVIIQAEMDSNKCGLPLLERIREKTGVSLDELISWEKPKPKPLSVTNTWEKANYTKHTLGEYVSSALAEMSLPEEQYNAYDKIISQITKIDGEIDKSVLSNEQQTSYDALTKNLTEVVSEKMREFEQRNNVAYNKDAVNSFSDAFQRFKKDSAQFKNQAALFSLVSETLFKYDASRLFNETLIYYNHVYSYIFAKLDDDGKLALTRFSIECEKKLR